MTFADWKTGLDSKALGSWNLHCCMPQNLDFFVIVASLNGIFGGRGQANYAAGNTYKDALAHYRIGLGLKAVAIDLGLVVDQGLVSENKDILDSLRRVGHLKDIRSEDLLALLDHYCDPHISHFSATKMRKF
ncbi:uncharacterized protein RCC_09428 [Ramularia collo-cygni]|uniref:Ketoreductase (KR) domain-containing protein n=1 Tax=Ramularia collo-cygni TaxID=112498 RepID=A0A2D3VM06_9PEZI|nr:uncharacterized protein RCC_09428 [Ramularia collo-cygni]CZT23714.1 uncharacterized protein RCC_09428 [Ramularia collo-cygni]